MRAVSLKPKGASMVQVLVASGLFAAMFLGTINLMREQAKTSQSSSREFEMVYTTDEIKALLADPAVCRVSLQGLNPYSDRVKSLKRPSESGELLELYPTLQNDPNALYGQKNLKISSYRITDGAPEVDVEAGTTEFIITFATSKDVVINQKRHLRLYIGLDSSGQISHCQSTPALTQTQSQQYLTQRLWGPSVARRSHHTGAPVLLGENPKEITSRNFRSMALGLNQSSGLLLLSEHAQKKCTATLEGSLRYYAGAQKIQLCSHTQNWINVPTYAFDPLKAKIFSTQAGENAKLDIGERRYCTLLRADVPEGQCSLSQEPTQRWQLHAIGSNTKCQAVCY